MGQTTFSGPVASQNGFIENSFTTAQRDAIVNPTAGLLIYNTTTNTYQVYNGSTWQTAFAPPAPPATTYTQGPNYDPNGVKANGSGNTLTVQSNLWFTPAEFAAVIATTAGTPFTVVFTSGGPSYSGVLAAGTWSNAGTLYTHNVTWSGTPPSTTGDQRCYSLTI